MSVINAERATEIAKCENNAAYYVETYGWIRHPNLGPIRFTLWPWQEASIDLWQAGKSAIFNKSRQVGATWTAIGFLSWLINFHPEIDTLVLSSKEEKAIKLLTKFKFFQDHVPDWLRAREQAASKTNYSAAIRYWDEGKQKWVDGIGSVSSLTTTGTSGAGDTARFVLVDEFALMSERGHDREVYAAIAPTTTHGGQMVILSTPRGSFGEFYRIWTESVDELVDGMIIDENADDLDAWNRAVIANAKDIDMVPMIAHYSMGTHDEGWLKRNTRGISKAKADAIREHFKDIVYNVEWRDKIARKLKLSKPQVLQEFELIFESMGNAAFSSEDINACRVYPEKDEWVRELINASTYFYVGVDTAEGIKVDNPEPDYNSICVFNESGVQVFALNNREGEK